MGKAADRKKHRKEELEHATANAETSYAQQLVDLTCSVGRFAWEHKGTLFFISLAIAGAAATQMQVNNNQNFAITPGGTSNLQPTADQPVNVYAMKDTATSESSPYICNDFTLLANTSAPKKARRYALAESHLHRAKTAACVDSIFATSKRPHRLFIEGVAANEEVPCNEFGYSAAPGRKCIGWESKESMQNLEADAFILDSNAFVDELQTRFNSKANIPDKAFDSFVISSVKNQYEASVTADEKKFGFSRTKLPSRSTQAAAGFHLRTTRLKTCDKFLEQRQQGYTWKHIFNRYHKERQQPTTVGQYGNYVSTQDMNSDKMVSAMLGRAKSMSQTINSYAGEPGTDVAAAGAAHFLPARLLKYSAGKSAATDEAVTYLLNEFGKGPHGNSFALLALDDILPENVVRDRKGSSAKPRKNT